MFPNLLVALHDVHPGTQKACEALLLGLERRGVKRVALMVIPNFSGEYPLSHHNDFVAWLKDRNAFGHELFVHGHKHRADTSLSRSPWGRWVNQRWAQGEAELIGLDGKQKLKIAEAGCSLCEGVGLPVIGFTPPTWFGPLQRSSMQKLGLRFQDRRWGVEDSFAGQFKMAPPLTWPLQKKGLIGGKAYFALLRRWPWIRLALHPNDADQPDFGATLDRLCDERRLRSYSEIEPGLTENSSGAEASTKLRGMSHWPFYPL
jgi:uncharacterized protein